MTIKGIIYLLIFGIACSVILSPSFLRIEALAQTTVCSGDPVVLVLNGYKQGSTVWKQSLDRIIWSNASGTTNNDSLVFIATNTLYYRAMVIDGTCSPFYSDTVSITVNPNPPVAKAASGVSQTYFTANWSRVAAATDYYLDVATDAGFTSFTTGKKNIGVGNPDTTISIEGLTCHTTYYYRVRAYEDSSTCSTKLSANSNTISVLTDTCPPPVCSGTMTDSRDGKIYKIIAIGTQCWMAQNLNVGTAILGEVQQTQQAAGIEKYCYGYSAASNPNDSSKCATYGGLYLWDEMMNYTSTASGDDHRQGICPTGWHIPTDDEWTTLVDYLGGDATAGGKMKDTSSHLWKPYNTVSTNSSGFSALPGGARNDGGQFVNVGNVAFFWSATENIDPYAWYRVLYYHYAQVDLGSDFKALVGFSVRCVKD